MRAHIHMISFKISQSILKSSYLELQSPVHFPSTQQVALLEWYGCVCLRLKR